MCGALPRRRVCRQEARRLCGNLTRRGASGWAVANVDAVVIAQSPRLSPHIVAMRERLAAALSVTPGQVGIKATTGEGLDAVGRSEAIAAHAVAVLRKTA